MGAKRKRENCGILLHPFPICGKAKHIPVARRREVEFPISGRTLGSNEELKNRFLPTERSCEPLSLPAREPQFPIDVRRAHSGWQACWKPWRSHLRSLDWTPGRLQKMAEAKSCGLSNQETTQSAQLADFPSTLRETLPIKKALPPPRLPTTTVPQSPALASSTMALPILYMHSTIFS